MRLLLLNWRDIRSARGGGAERVTHEVARRLVGRGWDVTWLSSAERGLPDEEEIDGVRVVRRGRELTTRLHAPTLARRTRPDVVLEEINTLPYLAPLWARAPVVLYMNQLARNVWWYEAPPPVAAVGWALEPAYLKAYRRCDAVTISHSSLADMRAVGIRGAITIAPMAVDARRADARPEKTLAGRLVAIGRFTPSKRYDHAIRALAELRLRLPDATLTLIGRGREEKSLRVLAERLEVADAVVFAGGVTEEEKIAVLDESDVLVGTSVREGWGLTVTEAAARGAPAIVYDIPGFRDAVVPGRTGLLVPQDPSLLAEAAAELLASPPRYNALAQRAWEAAGSHTYDATADAFESALVRAVGVTPRGG